MKAALRLAPSPPSVLGGTRRLAMVSFRLFLRVLMPFELYEGWRAIESYLSSPPKCVPQALPSTKRRYRVPHVKFAVDPVESSPPVSSSSSSSGDTQPEGSASESSDRRSRAETVEDRGPRTPRRPRRTRSVLGSDEARSYAGKGEPETLFRDTSLSLRGGAPSQHHLDLLALKADMYDKETYLHKQTIDELTEQLADAREVLSSTEMEVEQILYKNAQLHEQVKQLSYENRQRSDHFEQLREDLVTLHEWIYSVQAPLTQLGIFPTTLNERLNVKMKVPRPFPTLSPHVSSRLATSDEYFTPPSTPPPTKSLALKPEKRPIRPSLRCELDWEGEGSFALSSPAACSSPPPSRPGSPLACSSPKSSRSGPPLPFK